MKKPWLCLFLALSVLTLIMLTACEDDVGVKCKLVGASGADGGIARRSNIEPSALDCRSRLCLKYEGGKSRCTKTCDSDSDCPSSMENCTEGFRCIVAVETGPLRCCKVCVCKKDITDEANAGSTSCDQNPNASCPSL